MDPGQDWIDALRDLICKLYQAWGGNCNDLGPGATEWIDTLQDEYDTNGAPEFPTEAARQAFLTDISATEAHLDGSGNSLSPQDDAQLRTLLTTLENAVRNQGGT